MNMPDGELAVSPTQPPSVPVIDVSISAATSESVEQGTVEPASFRIVSPNNRCVVLAGKPKEYLLSVSKCDSSKIHFFFSDREL